MSNSPAESGSAPHKTRRVIGCLGIPVALIVITILGGWLWYRGEMSKARRDLAAEMKFVRDRGLPLTTVELDDFYRVDPEREDITAELLKALTIADDVTVQPMAVSLPIVGSGREPPAAEWGQLNEAEAYLAHHQKLLDLLATLPGRRVTVRYPADYTLGLHVQLPHLNQVRHAGRVLQLQWHVDMHRGRPEAAVNRILEMLALSETLQREPIMVGQLVRSALNGVALKMLADTLERASVSDADLARLQLALRHFHPEQVWSQALQGERAALYSASSVPLSMIASNPPTRQQAEAAADRPPLRPHDAALALRLFRRMEIANDSSIREAIAMGDEIDLELKSLAASPTKRLFHLQTTMLMPALSAASQSVARNAATLQSADVGLAAVRFRRVNQVWPQSLAQLVPEYLPKIPLDPFDGKPLRFDVTEREFKVYSVGNDQTDDGGDLAEPQPKDRGFVATWRAE